MSDDKSGGTVNSGGTPKPPQDEAAAEFDITGNAAVKGEKPSPADRERGETSNAESGGAIDLDNAHDRAS